MMNTISILRVLTMYSPQVDRVNQKIASTTKITDMMADALDGAWDP